MEFWLPGHHKCPAHEALRGESYNPRVLDHFQRPPSLSKQEVWHFRVQGFRVKGIGFCFGFTGFSGLG